MSIELLYIIPVVALSFLVVINIVLRQRNSERRNRSDAHLHREVEEFNVGKVSGSGDAAGAPESRLGEIEKTINLVTHALSSQQQVIEGFRGSNIGYSSEMETLKSRLGELQKEYDIILSENYSLRAKIRKLEARFAGEQAGSPGKGGNGHSSQPFQDTRVITDVSLGDTREWDLPRDPRIT